MKRFSLLTWLAALAALPFACLAAPQRHAPAPQTVDVVMLSDLHFDPLHDPAKVSQLRAAAPEDWPRILNAPASPRAVEDFAALQSACKMRGADSSWEVLTQSLHAAHAQQSKPLFVTVSGDLLAHEFSCRNRALSPSITPEEIAVFAGKTVTFVAQQLRAAFPGVPVYVALGNNDSGCNDYWETPGSEFLRNAARALVGDLTAADDRAVLLRDFSQYGDYDLALPAPMSRTRLIVLQDLFQSGAYKGCDGKPLPAAPAAQIDWLRTRLAAARKRGEHVWVMAHIPPGVNVYSSFHNYVLAPDKLCQAPEPRSFLGSDAFSETLTAFADVVRFAIFAHTHMDEMKLLHNASGGVVPAKLVPSVSPVNDNSPSFTVAQANPLSGTLRDYEVFVQARGSNRWSEEYRYSKVYGLPDYSAQSLRSLTTKFTADKTGDSEVSRSYLKWFYPGDSGLYALGLRQIWPAYSCAVAENGGPAFHQCMCPATAPAAK